MNDIVLNKKESIERCIKQVRTYYQLPAQGAFEEDYLRQDAIALNLQRACEQCIDLANHAIRVRKLGLPKESKDSFRLLAANNIIPRDLATHLEGMVGFRNVLVHEYQRMNIQIMIDVIENRLDDMLLFVDRIVDLFRGEPDGL
jgi:uncharacterized protein YutE (UPF0331/DUF86 family)